MTSDYMTKEQLAEIKAKRIMNPVKNEDLIRLVISALDDDWKFTTTQVANVLKLDHLTVDAVLREFARQGYIDPITDEWKFKTAHPKMEAEQRMPKKSVILHYAYKQEKGWGCSVCGTPYESKWDATVCCAYTKRAAEDKT